MACSASDPRVQITVSPAGRAATHSCQCVCRSALHACASAFQAATPVLVCHGVCVCVCVCVCATVYVCVHAACVFVFEFAKLSEY